MINNTELFNIFFGQSSDKQITLTFEDGTTIGNDQIVGQSLSITESLCSESSLRFGCCEASSFSIQIANQFGSLKGQSFDVKMVVNGKYNLNIGTYTVEEDEPTADRIFRDIKAYDSMYKIIHTDAIKLAEWYNSLWVEEDTTMSLLDFRNQFFTYIGLTQEETTLANDDLVIEKTISTNQLSGADVIRAICEINGCFGHFNRDNVFCYVRLATSSYSGDYMVYPGETTFPGATLYPSEIGGISISTETEIETAYYKSCTYSDYITQKITRVDVRQEENDIDHYYGSEGNTYTVTGNFLTQGLDNDALESVAKNLYEVVKDIFYRPANISAAGNPLLEVGDAIKLVTKYETVNTYILQRTLNGIQALSDDFVSQGVEEYTFESQSLESQITQVKGMVHKLINTTEQFSSQITNLDKGMTSMFDQTSEQIVLQVQTALDEINRAFEGYDSENSTYDVSAISASLKILKSGLLAQIDTVRQIAEGAVDETNENWQTISKYFEFTENGLKISSSNSNSSLTLDEDEIVFEQGGVSGTVIKSNKLRTGDVVIGTNNRLQMGIYAIVPRSNGGLKLLRVANA